MEDRELYGSFLFRHFTFAPGHFTDNSRGVKRHYLGYLYRGTARIVSEEGTLALKEGDHFYIPKGCRYRSCWDGISEVCFDSFAFDAIPTEEEVAFRLQKIRLSEEEKALYSELACDHKVNARSVGLLYRLLWELFPKMEKVPFPKGDALAWKIARYIDAHPDERTDCVARTLGVSESTLYHLLKGKLGKSPNQIRQEAKCRRAVNLLVSTDKSVEEISREVGFSSSSYMRKLLFAAAGKTPLQIRKESQHI